VYGLDVPTPVRCRRSKVIRQEHIETTELARAIEFACRKLPSRAEGGLLVLLDADDSCPAELGPQILSAADELRPDVVKAVVLPKREYEAWLIAAIASLRGQCGVRADAEAAGDPEDIRNAKGYLTRQMLSGRKYSETVDQVAMTAVFSLDEARACRSFRKLTQEVERLLAGLGVFSS
jgi:hypothetical protein